MQRRPLPLPVPSSKMSGRCPYPGWTLFDEVHPPNRTIFLTRLVRVSGRTRVRGRVLSCGSRCLKLGNDSLPIGGDPVDLLLFLLFISERDPYFTHCVSVIPHYLPTYPASYISTRTHSLVSPYVLSAAFDEIGIQT
jgi:hypothetical protein